MESKELMIRKKNYGYHILAIVFAVSLLGSIVYFSNTKSKFDKKNHKKIDMKSIVSFSGENSGEIIFSNVNEIKNSKTIVEKEEKDNTELQNNTARKENINQGVNRQENNEEETSKNSIHTQTSTGINFYASNRKLDKNKPMVALTFDDGPDPKRTMEIIEILNKYNVRASFFDIGNLMEKYPETLKAEVDSGCDVGGHTYTHTNLNNLSKEEIIDEMTKMEKAFRDATGQELKYIRPTYGNANSLVKETVKHPLINWCVDSNDWKSRDTDKILEEIYQTEDFDGKIVIMHVIYDSTVEAVKKLVPDLIQKGYQLVTISEMAEYKGYTLENGKVYYQF